MDTVCKRTTWRNKWGRADEIPLFLLGGHEGHGGGGNGGGGEVGLLRLLDVIDGRVDGRDHDVDTLDDEAAGVSRDAELGVDLLGVDDDAVTNLLGLLDDLELGVQLVALVDGDLEWKRGEA